LFEQSFRDRERALAPNLPVMPNPIIDHLLARRSASANGLGEPGPSESEIELILTAAARVPDHKKLVPWRFLLFRGEARKDFGRVLAEVCRSEEKDAGQFRLETEANRFLRAPLVIAVISRVVNNPAAPEWEQVLSAGAACQNMLVAATALGFGARWITEWCAYSEGVRAALGLAVNERVAGFVYVGTPKEQPQDRERPALAEIARPWLP
jgi:nitroreductase